MYRKLEHDKANLDTILRHTLETALSFLNSLEGRNVATSPKLSEGLELPNNGLGAKDALEIFMQHYGAGLSGSTGPRYFGFVTGGTTPAALAADWLTSTFDQNATGYGDSVAPLVELETLQMLRDLFNLPNTYSGVFVTGATMSNFSGLALARQWVGRRRGVDIAQDGLDKPVKVYAGTAHSSVYKALAMLGMGRGSLDQVACLEGREAADVEALETNLKTLEGEPCIIIANAGTVNTVDYDDIDTLVKLKAKYPFWLHVDAAFGGFAAVSPKTEHLVKGWEEADSITIDAHKWLNVPYDSAMLFTRHEALQVEVFQNAAVYLGNPSDEPNFVHRTPENSRRFRALAAWMTLQAYGKAGYQEMVERACELAAQLAGWIEASTEFRLLTPVQMNGVCFTFAENPTSERINTYLAKLRDSGDVFLTPTNLRGTPAVRIAISNWQTTRNDINTAWKDMVKVFHEFIS